MEYLDKSHIVATVNQEVATFSWLTNNTIQLDVTPTTGALIKIMRITPRDSKLVDFKDSAMLTGGELNKAIDQVFYTQQELDETVVASFTEYGEMIESKVIEASAHAANAEASEVAAKASEDNALVSETNAKASELAAKASEDNALVSETNAKASEVAAKASEVAAKASEVAAKASEDNALVSKTNAKASELAAKASEDNALTYANSINPELLQHKAEKDQPGGYAGLDNNGALNSKIRSTAVLDFNAATIGGLYCWGTASLNAPLNDYGTALVIDRLSSAYLTQIAIGAYTEKVYIRYSTNASHTEWTEWKRIDETVWGSIRGTLSAQTDLQTALNGKANTSHTHVYAPIPTSNNLPVGFSCLCISYYTITSGSMTKPGTITNGGTIAGSNLRILCFNVKDTTVGIDGGTLSGTWKNISGRDVYGGGDGSGLFVRIA